MLRKIVDTITGAIEGDFESYYRGIHRRTRDGGPTLDEARRDYRSAIRSHYVAW
jgi:hypothetical protein